MRKAAQLGAETYMIRRDLHVVRNMAQAGDNVPQFREVWQDQMDLCYERGTRGAIPLVRTLGGGHNGSLSSSCRRFDNIVTCTSCEIRMGLPA